MAEIARDAVEQAFESMPKPRRRDADAVAEAVRRAVRGAIAQRWNRSRSATCMCWRYKIGAAGMQEILK